MNDLNKPRFAAGEVHSAVNVAILAHLKKIGPSAITEIDQVLWRVDGYHDDSALTRLSRALAKLRQKRLVHRIDGGEDDLWLEGPPPLGTGADRAGYVAAPRQVNVMHGPVYAPAAHLPRRPGALDFQAVRSHGVRC